ncbi:hypothetical protein Nepgr_006835 [Nepenthes gracilis]|uniref:Cytochrome P450 n=1 Tax=Nepenthes gracilis TaxID=150966 RepID=A0AAD3XHT5_NEPGR|nr:hypothetical protein Nepgr_006835 [Nepenthes gracilis]
MENFLFLSFLHPSLTDLRILSPLALCGLLGSFLVLYSSSSWLKSRRQRSKLTSQGIKGPPPSFLYGNVPEMQRIQSTVTKAPCFNREILAHDYASTLFPYFEQWRKVYGQVYTYSTGNRQHLYVNNPEMVREMSRSMSLELGKPSYITKALAPMLGNGILRSNGAIWAQQRKIVAPEFFMDKVKGMVELMREAAEPLLRKWEACIIEAEGDGGAAEIEVGEDLRTMSAEVISRACFGSSYSKGKHIFLKLRTLQKLISNQGFLFRRPSFRFLNPKCQMEIRSLEKEIERLIWKAVEERVEECCGTGSADKDLLQLILDGALQDEGGNLGKTHSSTSKRSFIVDNCKNIYFAGHESTAVAASWCLMLLALHPEWQHRIRSEVDQVSLDDADSILKIKSVTMVIQEALRLYPPAAFISREALEEIEIGGIVVPKGVCVWTLIPTLHRDPEIWGPDANQFNPERFADGLSNACRVPQAYVPFGVGARLCLGRNFAMFQLKIILCLVVSKFSFSLSPRYEHAPAYRMIVEPGNGVHILVRNNEATYKADA